MKITMQVMQWQNMRRTLVSTQDADKWHLIYANQKPGQERIGNAQAGIKLEKIKEQMTPYLRELIQKIMKEEREYYKSRPSLAVKHYGAFFPDIYNENTYTSQITIQIYKEVENRLRKEWIRKGGG